jgi:acyl-CoA hydrolase
MRLSGLIATLRPGQSVFLPGSTGEPMGLMEALAEEGAAPLDITSSYLPGINRVPVDRLPEGSRFRCLFAHPEGTAAARKRGVFRHLPLSYGAFMKHLGERARFDACIVHVSPPDQHGLCTLGPAVEFTDMVGRCSGRVLAVINSRLPALPHSVSLPLSRFAETAEADAPLREYDIGAPSALATAIAKHVATFVRDGSTLQVGLGKVPDALMRLVSDRKELKLFSGMLSDGARFLADRGCLDAAFRHTACLYLGTQAFYAWLADRDDFAVAGCDTTHSIARLLSLSRFVSVNSAVSVDLFGQANLEMLGGRMISGVGGAADFARGAALAPDGISIVALPSVSRREAVSRIVPALDGVCSLPRHDVDVVVTEHGAADLRGLSLRERAVAIMAVAAPQHLPALERAFADMVDRL